MWSEKLVSQEHNITVQNSKSLQFTQMRFQLMNIILDNPTDETNLRHYRLLYNTLFSRAEIFAKSEFEIFSREDLFANILFTRKYLPAKIIIFPRKYLPVIFSVPQIYWLVVGLGYVV